MDFEWDDDKAESNLRKHGVGFSVVVGLNWTEAPILDDARFEYGEARYIGYLHDEGGAGYVVAFTLRTGTYRIISVRPFGRKELKLYGKPDQSSE